MSYTLTAKLTADASGFAKGFAKAQQSLSNIQSRVGNVGKTFDNIGKSLNSVGDKLTRSITTPALGATTALTGITLVKGFNRLTGIDTAQAKLMGLGHDAKNIEIIMNSALDSVKGTSYGLDSAATTAASAVAAGIKPGKELTRYLSLTGDAAAMAGDSMDGMGSIFNKVQTAQKAYTGDLNMLAERGIPIYQWLAVEANTSAEAIRDMASNGEVSSKDFLKAIENNIGGAAKIMGENSFTAGIANIWASVGRIGANFLDAGGKGGGFFSTMKPLLTGFNNSLGVVEDKAAQLGVAFGESFNNFLDKASEMKARFDGLSPSMQSTILHAVGIGTAILVGIGPALKIIGSLMSGFGTLATLASFLLSPIGLVAGAIIGLGVVFGIAMVKSEEFRSKVFAVFDTVKNAISTAIAFITPILQSLWSSGIEGAQSFASTIGDKLISGFQLISSVVSTVVDVIGQFVSSIISGFQGAGGEVSTLSSLFFGFNPILKLAMMVLSEFAPQIAQGFSQIASMAMPILNLLGQTLGQLAAAIIPMVLNVVSQLIPIIINLGTAFMSIVMAVLPILLNLFMQLVPVVMSLVTTVIGLVSQLMPLVSTIIDALVPVLLMMVDVILNIVQAVAPALIAIIGAVIAIFEAIMPVVMAVLTTVINVMANIMATIMPIIAFVAGIISSIIAIISPIITFIANVIASIFKVIKPITTFVSGVFTSVFNIISGIFRGIMQFISSSIQNISNTISKLSGKVSSVFNKIQSIVSNIMSGVSNIIKNVFNAITSSWDGLKSFVSGIFDGLGDNVSKLVSQVKGFVNVVIRSINSAIGLINKIPGVNISPIPQLQRGTDDWGGGFARMNEGGRGELVKLPNGTQVIPHDVSMKYAREAGKANSNHARIIHTNNSHSNENDSISAEIPIYIDGREIARATVDDITRFQKRTQGRGKRYNGVFV
ncbi:tape measure protein [Alkalihalobacillus trypoxylicola]|uniref:Tape measure protein N-terminal domain-containing protein n=1 Tax=Alkalihalobacillus trypoxylicola TaxID=519424 RepID=A0A161QAQ2_9BACI|nr:tape measure protein [Alkalihalobacillus trypoxylicola]KYG34907.1 hypothetical protein AZF04_00820 [Alkalihalobacillus trypoxylicola]